MKDTDIAQLIGMADDELIEEAAPKFRPTRRKWWIAAAAVAACFSVLFSALLIPWQSPGPKYDGSTPYVINADYLVGNSVVLSRNDHMLKKQLPTYRNFVLTAQVNHELVSSIVGSVLGFQAESDPGVELFTYWVCSQYNFDYRQHFSLFQREFVDSTFTPQAEECGYSYADAIERIDEVSSIAFQFSHFAFSCRLESVEDTTDVHLGSSDYPGMLGDFASVGIDHTKVSEVRTYRFSDCVALINGRFINFTDFDMDFVIYCYDGQWYIHPHSIEDDLSIDMLGKDVDWLVGDYQVQGVVTEVGSNYIILAGKEAYCSVEPISGIRVGDLVEVTAKRSGNMRFLLPDDPITDAFMADPKTDGIAGQRIRLSSLTEIRVISENEQYQDRPNGDQLKS